jgi:hypothetical protein
MHARPVDSRHQTLVLLHFLFVCTGAREQSAAPHHSVWSRRGMRGTSQSAS